MSDLVQKLVGALEEARNQARHPDYDWPICLLHEIDTALSEAKAGGWQPIEQASDEYKLRCWVLVGEAVHLAAYIVISFEEKRDMDGRYIDQVDHEEYWMDIDSGDPLEPTHFQPLTRPLPAPPAQKEPT